MDVMKGSCTQKCRLIPPSRSGSSEIDLRLPVVTKTEDLTTSACFDTTPQLRQEGSSGPVTGDLEAASFAQEGSGDWKRESGASLLLSPVCVNGFVLLSTLRAAFDSALTQKDANLQHTCPSCKELLHDSFRTCCMIFHS